MVIKPSIVPELLAATAVSGRLVASINVLGKMGLAFNFVITRIFQVMSKHESTRRQFLGSVGTTFAAGSIVAPLFSPIRAMGQTGPNDQIRVGAIGVGGRASLLLQQLPESATIVALCDCNLSRAEAFKAKAKQAWPVYQDYRKLLDRKDIDAVIVATGEFQRVLPCIHACDAGKDVYAEKPLTLYVREGRALVNAVRKYDRVLQVGSQQRSMAMNRVACELVRSGGLGKILKVQAINYGGAEASPANP